MPFNLRVWIATAAVAALVGSGAVVAGPAVDAAVEVVRTSKHGYLVTRDAVVPFVATVRGGHGLARVSFVIDDGGTDEQVQQVGGFERLLRPRELGAGRATALTEFRITADDAVSALDLGKLTRPPRGKADEPPPRARLRVCLEASTVGGPEPRTARSEPVTLVVVSEVELLAEIANEEEILLLDLEDRVVRRLREARLRLRNLNLDRPPGDIRADGLHDRAVEVREAAEKVAAAIGDAHTGYRRIVRELKANRVRASMVDRVEKAICDPLGGALRGECARSNEVLKKWCDRLADGDPNAASKAGVAVGEAVDALLERMDKVIKAARELDRVNREIKQLRDVENLIFDRR
jgi:hypothetical protein